MKVLRIALSSIFLGIGHFDAQASMEVDALNGPGRAAAPMAILFTPSLIDPIQDEVQLVDRNGLDQLERFDSNIEYFGCVDRSQSHFERERVDPAIGEKECLESGDIPAYEEL